MTGILHLLIRLWDILGIWQFDRFAVYPAQQPIQAGYRSGISPLAKLHPKDYQTRMRVSTAHIPDQLDLGFCVLVWMAVRPVRAVCQRTHRSVVFLSPAVDILPAGFVANRRSCYPMFQRIINYCLLKPHVLCYLIHSG